VNEKQCASDEELLSGMKLYVRFSVMYQIFNIIGCRVAVVPITSTAVTFLVPTTSIDSQYSAIITLDDSFKEHVVLFGFNGTNLTVKSSFCNISSLEVYRGREHAIEINHQGFSLSDNGSIEVRI
jgi:hypothetical protein